MTDDQEIKKAHGVNAIVNLWTALNSIDAALFDDPLECEEIKLSIQGAARKLTLTLTGDENMTPEKLVANKLFAPDRRREAEYIRAFGVAHCIECGDELPEHGVFDDPEKMICSPCWKRIQNPPESESTP